MIIDGHSHVTLPHAHSIEQMSASNIDYTILFSTSVHPELGVSYADVKQEMAKLHRILSGNVEKIRHEANLELQNRIREYPTHYIGFGNVSPGLDLKTTQHHLEQYVIQPGMRGVGEITGHLHHVENLFKASSDYHRLPIWIHGFNPFDLNDFKVLNDYLKRFPKTPVILGHAGGSYWMDAVECAKLNPNLYLDTSAFFSTFVLKTIAYELPERCLFGVDAPYGNLELALYTHERLMEDKRIRERILGENMAELLEIH